MAGRYELNRIISAAAAASLITALMSGCSDTSEGQSSYTLISDGTSIEVTSSFDSETAETDPYSWVSDSTIYVPEGMTTRYASLDYDARATKVYNDVVDTILSYSPTMLMPLTVSTDVYWRIMETVRCEQLMMFYVQNRQVGDFKIPESTFEMNFTYSYSIKEINIMLIEAEKAAKELIEQTKFMDDYEKLKYFHDWLALNVEDTTDSPYGDSVYGTLIDRRALCEGYAKTFSYLCNLSGIENVIVTGKTDVDHMWNMVKLDDEWYHVDVGWDRPSEAFFELCPDMILYQYFLTDDSVIKNNRSISTVLYEPPAANGKNSTYFHREGLYASDYSEALEIIRRKTTECIDSGDKYFMFKLDSSNLYVQTTNALLKQDADGVSDIDRIVSDLNFKGTISYTDYYKDYRIIIFILE